MKFTYTESDLDHSKIMEAVAKPCRSNKKGFIQGKTQKLDAIRELLAVSDSGYHEILLDSAQIWRKDISAPIDVIISSHADVVDEITKCSSVLSEDGYYNGTYDNSGTTAALVTLMTERNLPDNILVAFTADEETGRCNGAKQVLEYARNRGNDPVCIALDVTYEGYDKGHLFTVENLSSGHKKDEDFSFLNDVGNTMLAMDTEKQSCSFVRLNKHAIPTVIDQDKYMSKDSGWLDEAQIYVKEHAKGFSLCLPCDGSMHSNRGVSVRQPAYEGYINALEGMIVSMSKNVDKDAVLARVKEDNAPLIEQSVNLVEEEERLEEERRKQYAESRKGWYTPSSYGYYGNIPSEYSGEMSEDEYYDYLAYNASYGVDYYDEIEAPPSWYDPSFFDDFNAYVDSVIEDITEVVYEYSPEDRDYYISECLSYIPEDVRDYFGDSYHLIQIINSIFNSVFGLEDEDYEESEYDESVYEEAFEPDHSYDSDGYEYESSLLDLLKDDSYDDEKQAQLEIESDEDFEIYEDEEYSRS